MEILFFIAMMLVVVVLQAITPYVIRRGESFGVMVGEKAANDPALRKMKRQFLNWNLIVGGLVTVFAAILLLVSTSENAQATILISAILIVIILSFLIYVRFYKASLAWKKANLQVASDKANIVMVDTTFHRQKLTISYAWYLIPLALIFITIGLTVIYYDQIPSMIPMQYNFDNEVTREAAKNYRTVMMMPMMQIVMLGLFLFINYMMSRSKQVIDNDNPTASMRRNVLFRYIYSKFNLIMGTLLIALFMVIQLSFIFSIPQIFITVMLILVLVIIFGGLIFLMVRVGQGGSGLKLEEDTQADTTKPIRDDDANWKLGVFYFNRQDPAVFVEKRFGVGWTINMARPAAWLSFVAIIAVIVIIIIIFS
ncbi:DUF1648 domain-containing protein [Listeria weihenstephanensis]|uniref:DUF1648 domain-containing protein n=1 Tax=Listeria weihenstephanensis TaxID=1006155 RepID=A0A841ZB06_9LIST|nr:DUF5808 domain-containing protein [Listeria weihenstephanensis]MBC1501782.1 DUF1648 domain-containing protein [Listeria weihenstephanensis]